MYIGEDGFSRERKSYIDEIETLHRRLSTVERLETENQSLREKQHSLLVQLEKSKTDYCRLVEARQHLEDRLRESLDYSRKWKALHREWTRGIPGPEYSSSTGHPADASSRPPKASRLATSLPPLPLNPEKSPILRYRSTQQERASPTNHVTSNPQPEPSEHHHAENDGSNGLNTEVSSRAEGLHDGLGTSLKILGVNRDISGVNADCSALTEEGHLQHEEPALPPILPVNGPDSPIVVSERSLGKKLSRKRKAFPGKERVCAESGSAHKAVRVKSETDSSSPLTASRLDRAANQHDSLDLDEIEDSHYTPRKRCRMAEQRLRSSLHRSMTTDSDDERLLNDLKTQMFGIHNTEDEYKTIEMEEDRCGSDNSKFLCAGKNDEMNSKFYLQEDHAAAGIVASPSRVKPSPKRSMHAAQQMYNIRSRRSLGNTGEVGGYNFCPPKAVVTSSGMDTYTPSASGHASPSCPSTAVTQSSNTSQLETPQKATGNKQPVNDASILRVADPNARILPRTNQSPTALRRRDRGATVVPLVAEDGEENDQIPKSKKRIPSLSSTPVSKSAQKVYASHLRLDTLLNERPIPRAPLDPPESNHGMTKSGRRPAKGADFPLKNGTSAGRDQRIVSEPESLNSSTRSKPNESTPIDPAQEPANALRPVTWFQKQRNSTEAKKSSPKSASSPTNRTPKPSNQSEAELSTTKPTSSRKRKNSHRTYPKKPPATNFKSPQTSTADDTDEVLPEHELLRARPIHRLHIDDFKVNPNHNSGYDYAFKETVRKRDVRQCLPGCMKPSCCGDAFLKMVKLGGFPTLSTLSEKESEHELLSSYLGSDNAKLRHMTSVDKQELLIHAKARQLAEHYGKHRQAYERRTSPPGFWDVDFPSTQEVEGYREKAREMEREKVRERYREAVREGGAWLFRDE